MDHLGRHKLKVSPRPSWSPDLNILDNLRTYFQFLQDDPEISQNRKTLVVRVLANPSNRDWNTLGSNKKPLEAVIPAKGWRYRALTGTVAQTFAVSCTYELFFSLCTFFIYSNQILEIYTMCFAPTLLCLQTASVWRRWPSLRFSSQTATRTLQSSFTSKAPFLIFLHHPPGGFIPISMLVALKRLYSTSRLITHFLSTGSLTLP